MLTLLLATLVVSSTTTDVPSVPPTKAIVVDLEDQTLTCFEGTEAVMQFAVSTGRKGLETPTGVVKIQRKLRHNRALQELGGGAIPYTLRIYMYDPKQKRTRRINIHESGSVPNYPASSGCIRMKKGEGRKVYEWAPVGTEVHVVKDAPDCLL